MFRKLESEKIEKNQKSHFCDNLVPARPEHFWSRGVNNKIQCFEASSCLGKVSTETQTYTQDTLILNKCTLRSTPWPAKFVLSIFCVFDDVVNIETEPI